MSHYKPYPAFKDSGVEWIGKVPKDWDAKPLKFVASYNDDSLPESHSPNTPIRYVDISAVSHDVGISCAQPMMFGEAPSRARRKAKVGDVVVSTVRTYLKAVAFVDDAHADCVYSTGFAVLRSRCGKLAPGFLKWLALNELFVQAVESHSEGLSYPAINAPDLVNLKAAIPSMPEQIQITDILNRETARIDALIAKKTRFIELLKEKRQALITHAVTKGLDPNVKMKDSGVEWIGEMPENWNVVRLKHLVSCSLQYGANESGSDDIIDAPRYIRITDLNEDGELRADGIKRLDPETAKPYMISDGDILFARSGATVGKTYLHRSENDPACFAGYLIKARVAHHKILPKFLIHSVRSHYYWAYIQQTTIQATIENVGAERYGDFPVAVPQCEEQEQIIQYLSVKLTHMDRLSAKTQHSIDLLKERRSALITAAVTGKIDLRNMNAVKE